MEFCPKIFKVTSKHDFLKIPSGIYFDRESTQKMESCCKSILQCDTQKRAELNSTLIEGDIHCECKNKYRKCLGKSDQLSGLDQFSQFNVIMFGQHYFKKTAKCYSIDHPIIKFEQYKCYYQPKETYNQYPSVHVDGAV